MVFETEKKYTKIGNKKLNIVNKDGFLNFYSNIYFIRKYFNYPILLIVFK